MAKKGVRLDGMVGREMGLCCASYIGLVCTPADYYYACIIEDLNECIAESGNETTFVKGRRTVMTAQS